MPDTPTPAPALTDDEIDTGVAAMIVALARVRPGGYEDRRAHGRAVIAAVVARAKREAAEEIAGKLEAAAAGMRNDLDDYGRGLRNGFRLASRRAESEATR